MQWKQTMLRVSYLYSSNLWVIGNSLHQLPGGSLLLVLGLSQGMQIQMGPQTCEKALISQ